MTTYTITFKGTKNKKLFTLQLNPNSFVHFWGWFEENKTAYSAKLVKRHWTNFDLACKDTQTSIVLLYELNKFLMGIS